MGNGNSDKLKRLYTKIDLNQLNDFILEHNLGGFFYYLYGNQTFKNVEIPSPNYTDVEKYSRQEFLK
ncbi:MAG: hypothetical protein U5N58_02715 [Actinomycetota bacterium]|nr:hypothetical protein [Actinomycetota bacterium]